METFVQKISNSQKSFEKNCQIEVRYALHSKNVNKLSRTFFFDKSNYKLHLQISVIVCIMTQRISSILQEREKMVQPFFSREAKIRVAFNLSPDV